MHATLRKSIGRESAVSNVIANGTRRYAPRLSAVANALAVAGGAFVIGGCGPCDGVIGCNRNPRLDISGQFIDRDAPGTPPLGGVRVEVIRISGVGLSAPSVVGVSDATGWWSVSIGAGAPNAFVNVDLLVTPPAPNAPYRVRAVQFATTSTYGAGAQVGRWVAHPYITYVGLLLDAASGRPIANANVTIVPRGGVAITPTPATKMSSLTDESGQFVYDVRPADLQPLFVDFYVDRPGLPRAVVTNAQLDPSYEDTPPRAFAASTFTIDSAGRVSGGLTQSRAAARARGLR